MTAVDTNLLIFAADRSSRHHDAAHTLLAELAEGSMPWAIPWPCAYEFLRVATHPRVFRTPLPPDQALRMLQNIIASPSLAMLSETPRHAELMSEVLSDSGAKANGVHDAHIWTLCLEHGVGELISADRDFLRFRGLRLVNPFA